MADHSESIELLSYLINQIMSNYPAESLNEEQMSFFKGWCAALGCLVDPPSSEEGMADLEVWTTKGFKYATKDAVK